MTDAGAADAKAPTADELTAIAGDYMVPVSPGTINDIASRATPETRDTFTEYAKQQAIGLYPTFAGQIRGGMTTQHLLDPYRQVGKQVLGESFEPDFVGDPKATAALTGGPIDEKTGRATPMTLDQWKMHLKSTPEFGWQFTAAAHDRANMVARAINDGFTSSPQGR